LFVEDEVNIVKDSFLAGYQHFLYVCQLFVVFWFMMWFIAGGRTVFKIEKISV